jgi:mannose-1-phosphate guanylyltransferase
VKAFLLAAGNGTRLRPLTDSIPKCMVPIQGKPLLDIWLEWCAMNSIDQVLLNTHTHNDVVREHLKAYRGSVAVTMTYEPELLGSAGTIHMNRRFVSGEQEFAILYADVLTNCRFSQMLEYHRSRSAPITMGIYHVSNPSQCGIVITDESGMVVQFTEKPKSPKTNTAFSGILIAGPAFFSVVPERIPSDIGFHVLPNLIGKMFAFPISDYLLDIGTMQQYEQAQQDWAGFL